MKTSKDKDKMKRKTKTDKLAEEWLSDAQRWYWRDPEKARALQRAKYDRYPDKIYAANREWQKRNSKHFSKLCMFSQKICKARKAEDWEQVSLLVAAKEEYKKAWRDGR